MCEESSPISEESSRIREESSRIREISSPQGAYEWAHRLAKEVVVLGSIEFGSKEITIDRLTAKYGLGSFLRKVFYGEPATIHLHLYHRLCNALEDMNERQQRRIEHNKYILRQMRKQDADPTGIAPITNQYAERTIAAI